MEPKRWASLALSLLLAAVFTGCGFLPSEDFDDYDVSSYIQALLDSSYHNTHESFMSVAHATQETAQSNNTTTVENAAVNFCNAYSLSPTDQQLAGFQDVMSKALLSARYTVQDEQKVDTGYTIQVDVSSISSLCGLQEEFAKLRTQAQEEAAAANSTPAPAEDGDEGEDEDGWDEDAYGEEEPTPIPAPTPAPTPAVDAYQLYIDKVLEYCRAKVSQVDYEPQAVSIVMDIRLTDQGELQLDLNQLDAIDQAVLLFSK